MSRYKGPAYPLANDGAGNLITATDGDLMAAALKMYMFSGRGWQPYEDHSGDIESLLMEPNTNKIKLAVWAKARAAERVFPIRIEEVTVTKEPGREDKNNVYIQFHLVNQEASVTTKLSSGVPNESV